VALRLTGLLPKKPWKRGFFMPVVSPATRQARPVAGQTAVSWNRSARSPGVTFGRAGYEPLRIAHANTRKRTILSAELRNIAAGTEPAPRVHQWLSARHGEEHSGGVSLDLLPVSPRVCRSAHRAVFVEVRVALNKRAMQGVVAVERTDGSDACEVGEELDHPEAHDHRVQRHQRWFNSAVSSVATCDSDPAGRITFEILSRFVEVEFVSADDARPTGHGESDASTDRGGILVGFDPDAKVEVGRQMCRRKLREDQPCAIVVHAADDHVNVSESTQGD
jgi:hypothetical protein